MPRPELPSKFPARFAVGERASYARTFTEGDMTLFIGATWDVNPYHTDDGFAAQTRFGRRIVPGLLPASMATHLGGLWGFLATEIKMQFLAPVYVGDTVRIDVEIVAVDERGRVQARCSWINTDGVEVMRGEFAGFPSPSKSSGNGAAGS